MKRGLVYLCYFSMCTVAWLTDHPKNCLAFSLDNPEYIGIGGSAGSSYTPDPTFPFSQLSISAIYDYEQIMGHRAPEPLRFKFEGNVGIADIEEQRLLASANFYALYYIRRLAKQSFKPYIEGGAGIVYSDFQVEGQGLRWNFNPQAGAGFKWQSDSGSIWYSSVHAYHISNGGLNSDNRGINGILFQVGYLF